MQIIRLFGSSVGSLKLKVDKLMAPGGDAACRGHWSLSGALIEELSAKDTKYELRFVATKVTYTDGTVEVYP